MGTKPNAAQQLYISMGTLNTRLSRIREKYQVVGRPITSKAALVARAVRDGLVSDEL